MIAFVEGILVESEPLHLVVNVNGLGYELHVPLSTSSAVGRTGERVRLHTQLIVREDSHQLYGFATVAEKTAFVTLTEKVSGIGPRIALNILSRLSVQSLQSAISTGNVSLLTQCPGIGKKTAERLILELKDVVGQSLRTSAGEVAVMTAQAVGHTAVDDAIAALVTLGFKQLDAQKRLEKVLQTAGGELPVDQMIKRALNG
jgi:holliday junction DNA helicase RuvA